MASTSRGGGATGRIKNLASSFSSDYQPLITDIRKTMNSMKDIAVELEKEGLSDKGDAVATTILQPHKVKELEDAVLELAGLSGLSVHFSSAVQAFANRYQPGEELTDFHKVFEDEVSQFKANPTSDPKKHPFVRQFKEAVWNVHHEGQPMPGEEQEDIVMTSTQSSILNMTCPMTGKPVTELEEPVRSMGCKHIYEKKVIMTYLRSKQRCQCPVSGCPKILQADKVVSDPLLPIEIDELRKMTKETNIVEDFTMLDEDE